MWWRGEPKKIFAYGEPIDMRCSFDGVVAAVKAHLGADPLTGDFYVFVNRRRTLLKGVFGDRTRWCCARLGAWSLHVPRGWQMMFLLRRVPFYGEERASALIRRFRCVLIEFHASTRRGLYALTASQPEASPATL
jgi:hypothetical protein